jgi:pyruvate dehydrogenase E2 component (dihydrolipoamide acetyltransferase)
MATFVRMPQKGLTEESAFLSKWYVKTGDTVKEGDLLFALETGKAVFDVEAEVSGTVLELVGNEGDEILVKAVVLVIGTPGEVYSLDGPAAPAQAAPPPVTAPAEEPAKAAPAEEGVFPGDSGFIRISPRARRLAEKNGLSPEGLRGSGPGGRIIEEDVKAALSLAGPPRQGAAETKDYSAVPHDNFRRTITANMMKSLQ